MRADLQLKFTGISQALQRSEQLRRLMQISVIAGGPLFAGRLQNPSQMLRTMIDLLGYSSTIQVADQPVMQPPGVMTPTGEVVSVPMGGAAQPQGGPQQGAPAPGAAGGPPRGVGAPPKLAQGESVDMPTEQGLFQGTE